MTNYGWKLEIIKGSWPDIIIYSYEDDDPDCTTDKDIFRFSLSEIIETLTDLKTIIK